MERDINPDQIDKSRVLDVRPLRCLAPIFPSQPGSSAFSSPQSSPFMCVPPTGPFPPGVAPFYPFSIPTESQRGSEQNPVSSPMPLNAFRTPTSHGQSEHLEAANGDAGSSRRNSKSRSSQQEDDGGNMGSQKGKQKRTRSGGQRAATPDADFESMANDLLRSFNLEGLSAFQKDDGDKELVHCLLLAYDLLRRKLTLLDDGKEAAGGAKRPDLRAGAILMNKGVRTNMKKRIGGVPGVEVGDIFFFRMEMCLVGLHAPSMAGIDYMSVKITMDEEPVAVSIVSSGGYDDDGDDGEVLIYSGQGGVQRKDGQLFDQKLERGNLALEKSMHRANEVRVVRGLKDAASRTGKVYIYDGLYKIQESWTEKSKSGCNVFKYKLVRVPGQTEAFTLWKSIQQWKDGAIPRLGVILPDLTSGAESLPVSLINDVDDEKGPAYFSYSASLKYSKPLALPKESLICSCQGGCQPGVPNCPCVQRNGGYLPYTSSGVLLSHKTTIYECGPSCLCPPNCKNRISQAGSKVRFEVFKTVNKGWGLRSWDPIRGGSFICEYAGEVIDPSKLKELEIKNEDDYIFYATRTYEPLETVTDGSNQSVKIPFPLVISSRNGGNVARFMNHSCSPNVYWQPVVRENDNESSLHIAFFAIRHIPPMRELSYDYGMVQSHKGSQKRKKCFCGSVKCKGYFD